MAPPVSCSATGPPAPNRTRGSLPTRPAASTGRPTSWCTDGLTDAILPGFPIFGSIPTCPSPGGLIQGSPKKAGSIAISRAVRVGRGGPRLEAGATFAGHVSSLGQRVASGSVTLDGPADSYFPGALSLPVWHTRLVPDLAGTEPLVHDLAHNLVTDFAVAEA